jgi:hypothetical protein
MTPSHFRYEPARVPTPNSFYRGNCLTVGISKRVRVTKDQNAPAWYGLSVSDECGPHPITLGASSTFSVPAGAHAPARHTDEVDRSIRFTSRALGRGPSRGDRRLGTPPGHVEHPVIGSNGVCDVRGGMGGVPAPLSDLR